MTTPPTNVSVAAAAPGTNEITPVIEDSIISGAVATETTRAQSAEGSIATSLTALSTTVTTMGSQQVSNVSAIGSLQSSVALSEMKSNKGVASGYAGLDSSAKIPLVQLPASVIGSTRYVGMWNASTNTPALSSGASTVGTGGYYVVSVSGTTTLDSLSVWNVGDWAVFNGIVWQKLDGQANPVSSVAGRQGAVSLNVADVAGALPSTNGTATGLVLLADPSLALGAATKQYVDTKVAAVSSGGTSTSGTSTYIRNTYTTSGTLSPTDSLSIVSSSTAVIMTLANGSVDNHSQIIKQLGAGSVSISGTFDGTAQTLTLNMPNTASGFSTSQVYESINTRYILALNTYILE